MQEVSAGKILIPGVVGHTTDLVEHTELIANRIIAFAEPVGRENAINLPTMASAATSHPQIAWAKMRALRDGAVELNSKVPVRDQRNKMQESLK